MIKTTIDHFLNSLDRSPKTVFTYPNALEGYAKVVGEDAELNTDPFIKFLIALNDKSPATQRVYTTAVLKFYVFCKVRNWAELKDATSHYTEKSGQRAVNFNREALEKMIAYYESLRGCLFDLRDRAFVLTLADTGLRVSEECSLKARRY
jgi:integrase/recombinase XerC